MSSYPVFIFSVKTQEIDCLVSTKKEDLENESGQEVIVKGSPDVITSNTYYVAMTLHDNPELEEVGHIWKVTDFKLAEKHKMLL